MKNAHKELNELFTKLIEEPELEPWSRFGSTDSQDPNSNAESIIEQSIKSYLLMNIIANKEKQNIFNYIKSLFQNVTIVAGNKEDGELLEYINKENCSKHNINKIVSKYEWAMGISSNVFIKELNNEKRAIISVVILNLKTNKPLAIAFYDNINWDSKEEDIANGYITCLVKLYRNISTKLTRNYILSNIESHILDDVDFLILGIRDKSLINDVNSSTEKNVFTLPELLFYHQLNIDQAFERNNFYWKFEKIKKDHIYRINFCFKIIGEEGNTIHYNFRVDNDNGMKLHYDLEKGSGRNLTKIVEHKEVLWQNIYDSNLLSSFSVKLFFNQFFSEVALADHKYFLDNFSEFMLFQQYLLENSLILGFHQEFGTPCDFGGSFCKLDSICIKERKEICSKNNSKIHAILKDIDKSKKNMAYKVMINHINILKSKFTANCSGKSNSELHSRYSETLRNQYKQTLKELNKLVK